MNGQVVCDGTRPMQIVEGENEFDVSGEVALRSKQVIHVPACLLQDGCIGEGNATDALEVFLERERSAHDTILQLPEKPAR